MSGTLGVSAEAQLPGGAPAEKGLKPNALSLVANIVIGVASVAPAYSLAATLGLVPSAQPVTHSFVAGMWTHGEKSWAYRRPPIRHKVRTHRGGIIPLS